MENQKTIVAWVCGQCFQTMDTGGICVRCPRPNTAVVTNGVPQAPRLFPPAHVPHRCPTCGRT